MLKSLQSCVALNADVLVDCLVKCLALEMISRRKKAKRETVVMLEALAAVIRMLSVVSWDCSDIQNVGVMTGLAGMMVTFSDSSPKVLVASYCLHCS